MIAEEDVKKSKSKLNTEEIRKLLYYSQKEKLIELKELARKKSREKYVKVMRKYINIFIKKLEKDINIKKETTNLLTQTKSTLMNVHRFIRAGNIIDANVLLRSAFENLIMGMMINENDDVYNEFINLSINDSTRKYTKPQNLRNSFRKVLRKLDGDLFIDMSNKNLKDMLDEFYDGMCFFSHSTILVNVIIEMEKEDDQDIYIVVLKQNTYFMETLLYLCLKKLCKYQKNPIDITYALLGWYILISDVPKEKATPEKMKKLERLLHSDINIDYIEKNKKKGSKLTDEAKKLQDNIQNNPIGFIELLQEIIKY